MRRGKSAPSAEPPVTRELTVNEKVVGIFAQLLPSVGKGIMEAFANAMQAYHDRFRAYRESGRLDYEGMPGYGEQHAVLVVHAEAYWVQAVQFQKLLARTLGELFGTRITALSASFPVEEWRTLVFMDATSNRWAVTIRQEENEMHVSALLPRSNTTIRFMRNVGPQELAGKDEVGLQAYDISAWSA